MNDLDVTIVSHPFASNGMGEQGRAGIRSLLAVGVKIRIYDLFRYAARKDVDYRKLVLPLETASLPGGIRIFHINGDEVENALTSLREKESDFNSGYNIIVPAWELPVYPDVWVSQLKRFNEVWAISRFVESSLKQADLNCHWIGQSVNAEVANFLPRRYFGMRESSFAVLSFFDTASYAARKNPDAVIRVYKRFRELRPYDDLQLVLKVRSGDQNTGDLGCSLAEEIPKDVVLIPRNYESYEIRSLIAASDCLLSLHRSEGFGRGLAEAMDLNRLAMGTGWSGNCDFMSPTNSLFVNYKLIPVEAGQYPCWEGQEWAEPDEDHALHLLLRAIDEPSWARDVRKRGRIEIMTTASSRAVGLRALDRLKEISRERPL